MATLWTNFAKEPVSIRDTGRKANQVPLTLSLAGGVPGGPAQVQFPGVVNMTAMAEKFPSVAADFKQAGLTPQQWEQDRKILFAAFITDQYDKHVQQQGGKAAPGNASALWQNVTFLRTHQKEFDALKATGMWFPTLTYPAAGNTGSDLNP